MEIKAIEGKTWSVLVQAPYEVMKEILEIPGLWLERDRLENLTVLDFEMVTPDRMFGLKSIVTEFTQRGYANRVVNLLLARYVEAKRTADKDWRVYVFDPEFWQKELFPAHCAPQVQHFQDKYKHVTQD